MYSLRCPNLIQAVKTDCNLQFYKAESNKYSVHGTGKTSVEKLLFQVKKWSIQKIHPLHTMYKESNVRLNMECPVCSPVCVRSGANYT